jgi:hypothetical protein
MPRGIGYGKKQTGDKKMSKGTRKQTSKAKGSSATKGKSSNKKRG